MIGGNNPLSYKNYEKEIIQNAYTRVSDNLTLTDVVDNYQNLSISLLKNLPHKVFYDFIKNKTVVDAGSGIGKFLPFIKFFNPSTLLSVEIDNELTEEQIKFCNCKFYFLPNSSISKNLKIFNQSIETFIDTQNNIDTICFFQNWHYIDFEYIASKINADMIFFTKTNIEKNIYETLAKTNYKIVEQIHLKDYNLHDDYFFAFAKTT